MVEHFRNIRVSKIGHGPSFTCYRQDPNCPGLKPQRNRFALSMPVQLVRGPFFNRPLYFPLAGLVLTLPFVISTTAVEYSAPWVEFPGWHGDSFSFGDDPRADPKRKRCAAPAHKLAPLRSQLVTTRATSPDREGG